MGLVPIPGLVQFRHYALAAAAAHPGGTVPSWLIIAIRPAGLACAAGWRYPASPTTRAISSGWEPGPNGPGESGIELDRIQAEYNSVRLNAAIGYVVPDDEHDGRGETIRRARRDGLAQARLDRIAYRRNTSLKRTSAARPKLRLIWRVIPGLNWVFAAVGWCRSGYFKVSGIGALMSLKACCWALVGSASMGTVAVVPVNRTWLRVSVARCSSRPRKLW